MKLLKQIYNKVLREKQLKTYAKTINSLNIKSVLDVGCMDEELLWKLNQGIAYVGIDENPKKHLSFVEKISIEDFKSKIKFDCVCAFSLLEHIKNPVEVMKKLKSFSGNYIFIAVPYEPFFTLFRGFVPEQEHFWTIHPSILKHYFGEPIMEKFILFKRKYLFLCKINKNEKENMIRWGKN